MVVAEGSFRVFTAETVTGKILADLPVDSHKWGVRLNDGGPLSCVVDCYTEEAQAMDIRNVTGQWRTCLGVSYNGVVLEAGPIIDRSFNAETGKLDLTAKGIWSIFDRRKMIMGSELHQDNPFPQKSTWVMGPTSLRTIAREIVRVSIQDNPYTIKSYLDPQNLLAHAVFTDPGWDARPYITYSSSGGYSGGSSLLFGSVSSQSGAYFGFATAHRSKAAPLLRQQKYKATVWVQPGQAAAAGDLRYYLRCYRADGTYVFASPAYISNTSAVAADAWVQLSGEFTIPDESDLVGVPGMYVQTALSGAVYSDPTLTQKIETGGFNAGHLPIILPTAVAGTDTRTYHGYELVWMGAELRKYTQLSGGPDIRFVPRFKPGAPTYIEWVMETGTPSAPLLKGTGDPWKWDGTRDDSGVTGLSTVEDGSGMAVRSWVPGQGQENDMPLAKATNTDLLDASGPWLEGDSAAKLEEESNILQSIADRAAADSRAPMNTISLSVRADFWPYLGNYTPGDMARVVVPPGHPTLNPGPIDVRIMAVDGSDADTVNLTLSPVVGSLAGSPWAESITTSVDVPLVYPSDTLYPSFQLFPSDDE